MNEIIDCVDNGNGKDSKIMVIGVGGGGSNAVKYMYDVGIHNVDFMVCNTDAQALRKNPVPSKIQLGGELTKGLGAGNKPDTGRDAALESKEEIRQSLKDAGAQMVFITAGMGGGTGTGAAPVIAEVARDEGILTVGIITIPFRIEGPKRLKQAELGLEEMKCNVDSLLVIDNENIYKMYGELDFTEAFGKADDILAIAAKGIAEAITKEHRVNVDFADIKSIMSNSGISLLGYASSQVGSDNVAIQLTEEALVSPLLNRNNILGAQEILLNISWNERELKMSQLYAIIGHIQAAAGSEANVIWGAGRDATLESSEVSLIVIATNFKNNATINLGENIVSENISKIEIAPSDKQDEAVAPHTEDAQPNNVEEKEAVEINKLSLDDEPKPEPKPEPKKESKPEVKQETTGQDGFHYIPIDDEIEATKEDDVIEEKKEQNNDITFTEKDVSELKMSGVQVISIKNKNYTPLKTSADKEAFSPEISIDIKH